MEEWKKNLFFHYNNLIHWEPKLFWAGALVIFPSLLKSLSYTLLLTILVRGVEEGWDYGVYFLSVITILVIHWGCGLGETGLTEYCSKYDFSYRIRYMKLFADKKMKLRYETLMKKDVQDLSTQAYLAVFQGRGIQECIVYQVLKYARKREAKEWPLVAKEIGILEYLSNRSKNIESGKDIRLFAMYEWLAGKYDQSLEQVEAGSRKIQKNYFYAKICEICMGVMKNAVTYIFLVFAFLQGEIGLSSMVFFRTVVSTFSI